MAQEKKVSRVSSTGNIEEDITRAVSVFGGFEHFVKPGEKVLVKPNYNSADPPPASSDPAFVATIVKLLLLNGITDVIVCDSSMFALSTLEVFTKTGLRKVAEEEGARVAAFGDKGWVKVNVGQRFLKKVEIAKELSEVDKLIDACCLKTHRFADFSISLKLGMGFTKPLPRIGWHIRGREEKIAELNTVIKPDLIILDARKCFVRGGPFSGEVAEPNLILASNDRIALDVEGIKIIQSFPRNNLRRKPWEYTQIKRATELGIGANSEAEYDVIDV